MILDIETTLRDIPEVQEWIIEMINAILIEVLAQNEASRRLGKYLYALEIWRNHCS